MPRLTKIELSLSILGLTLTLIGALSGALPLAIVGAVFTATAVGVLLARAII
jgi:hypothetical protein